MAATSSLFTATACEISVSPSLYVMPPRLTDLNGMPPFTARTTSPGFVKRNSVLNGAYFGFLYASQAFSTGTTYALRPGGVTCSSSFLRSVSFATSSLQHIMRLQPVIFDQTVATWP